MLSPKQYIIQRSNQLPLVGCYIMANWNETKMSPVVVVRQHTTGNYTFCYYLVDLFCLGVKDTFFRFNESVELSEIVQGNLVEIDYNLAHNIIYAAYEYALEFDLAPHADFEITKHFLLPDNDDIPLIDIEVGDEEGNPVYMPYKGENTGAVLAKLNKNPGKGNYQFIFKEDAFDEDDEEYEYDEEYDDEDNEEDNEEDESLELFAQMSNEIDKETEDMNSEEALDFYKFICKNYIDNLDDIFPELNEKDKIIVNLSGKEAMKNDVIKMIVDLLVEKYNQFYFEERKITASELMMGLT